MRDEFERARVISRPQTQRVDTWAWRALTTSAVLVYGVFVGAHVVGAEEREAAALVAILTLPFLYAFMRRFDPLWTAHPRSALLIATLVQCLPFFALSFSRLDLIGAAVLVFLQGHLLLYSRDVRAAVAALAIGPGYVLLEMSLNPAGLWLGAFAAAVVISVVGLVFLTRRESRRRTLERAPALLRRIELERSGNSAPRSLRETAYGIALGLFVVLMLPVAYVPLSRLPDPTLGGRDQASEPDLEQNELPPGNSEDSARRDAAQTLGRIFPSNLALEGGVSSFEPELFARVRPVPARDLGPLHLRGMVLDTIHADGASFRGGRRPARLADEDDGASDGWTQTETAPPGSAALTLDITQRALTIRSGGSAVVFSPRPLIAVQAPMVEHDPDGVTVVPADNEFWLELRLAVAEAPTPTRNAERRPDPRYLQLPDSPALATIVRLARDVTRAARDDRGRVMAVLAYFQDNFRYALESAEFPGLLGVLDFLEEKRGHCSYYATASVLMLRTVGIPARIATGFLASQYDPDEEAYLVTTKNGHAWIEVEFEGVGWIPLDPTPAGPRAAAFAALDPDAGMRGWLGGLWYDLDSWVETGDGVYLRHFLSSLLDAPAALLASLVERPWIAVGIGLGVLAFCLRRRLGRRVAARANRSEERRVAGGLFARMLRALGALGHRRRPAQTLLEFATELSAQTGELAQVRQWIERFYRARYGGEALGRQEQAALEHFVGELHQRASAKPAP